MVEDSKVLDGRTFLSHGYYCKLKVVPHYSGMTSRSTIRISVGSRLRRQSEEVEGSVVEREEKDHRHKGVPHRPPVNRRR